MKIKSLFFTACWLLALYLCWRSGPWSDAPSSKTAIIHDDNFHMHDPLHAGGMVRMSGQFHLELVSSAKGEHRLWVSNAFRQELHPVGFAGKLTIASKSGDMQHEVLFKQVGNTRELIAHSKPLSGQVTLKVQGRLGDVKQFKDVTFFWDYDITNQAYPPPLGLNKMVPRNSSNKITRQKVALGKELFSDPMLSADGSTSCASCHQPKHAFAESIAVAKGIHNKLGRRNTPTLLNVVYQTSFTWDGRSKSLEEQIADPIFNHAEMGFEKEADFVKQLQAKYATRIQKVMQKPLSLATVADAIACYERTLFSGDSNFDRYEAGDKNALNDGAQRGRSLFYGKANCGDCHIPPLLTDGDFHNLGVGWNQEKLSDEGRFAITKNKEDHGAFKTPSLRDVDRTAPYMHDGSIATLKEVLQFYNKGCRHNPTLDENIQPLNLSEQEQNDIIEFLKSLNGRYSIE